MRKHTLTVRIGLGDGGRFGIGWFWEGVHVMVGAGRFVSHAAARKAALDYCRDNGLKLNIIHSC